MKDKQLASVEVIVGLMGERTSLLEAVTPGIGEVLGQRLEGLRDGSLFNLAMALVAIETVGVAGQLVIQVPRQPGDRLEVSWSST